MAAPHFPLVAGQIATPGTGVSLALVLDIDPENPLAGDLRLLNGQIHFWDAQEARRQKLRMILQFFKGEWWLNREEGIPYFTRVIGKNRKAIVLNVFRQAILTAPGLVRIDELSLDVDPVTRLGRVAFRLLYDDGTTINSADFGPTVIKIP